MFLNNHQVDSYWVLYFGYENFVAPVTSRATAKVEKDWRVISQM